MGEILIRQGDQWSAPNVVGYALESEMQVLLAEHPDLVPGVGPGARSCREFLTEPGPVDVVVVDGHGELTLVECKLASNPHLRREIIGQLFEFASCFWRMDVNDFLGTWRSRGTDLLADLEDEAAEAMRDGLTRNLADGRFRLVLAVDEINKPLKRIVEYLNMMCGPDTSVIAVAYTRMSHESIELLVPEIYGQESAEAKARHSSADKTMWDLPTYRSWIQENDSASIGGFDVLVAVAGLAHMAFSGSLSSKPSACYPLVDTAGRQLGRLSVLNYSGLGTSLELNLTRLTRMSDDDLPPADARRSFVSRLSRIREFRDVARNLEATDFGSRGPNVPLSSLSAASIHELFNAIQELTSRPFDLRAS